MKFDDDSDVKDTPAGEAFKIGRCIASGDCDKKEETAKGAWECGASALTATVMTAFAIAATI